MPSHPSKPMSERAALYRSAALEQYIRSQEQAVLPRLVKPRIFRALWALSLILAAGVLFASTLSVPNWHRGTAVVLGSGAAPGDRSIVVFLPRATAGIQPGAALVLEPQAGPTMRSRVRSVETGVIAPGEAVRRFGLQGAAAAVLSGPSVVVLSSPDAPALGGLPASVWAGSVVPARVRGEDRRVISLLREGEDR